MRLYGLIGKPLTHSFSQIYFRQKFEKEKIYDAEFELFTLDDISELNVLINSHQNLIGFSVTIPYKEQIIKYLDEISKEAEQIGAVNSVKIIRQKNRFILQGYNTDVIGFGSSLDKIGIKTKNIEALVLGNGGAAKAVSYVLNKKNIPFKVVSRNPENQQLSYDDITLDVIENHKLIINTTPLGMFPNIDECPTIPYEALSSDHYFIDLTYNPPLTAFLKNAQKNNAKILNGMHMLEIQAEASWRIWNQ